MSVKYFCDGCGAEITKANACSGGPIYCSDRLGTKIKKRNREIKVEIITSMDGTANAGNLCKHCVLDALYELDDRKPKLVKR